MGEQKLRRPQYRTLVKALAELHDAVTLTHGPAGEDSPLNLGQRMEVLARATYHAEEVLERARSWMDGRAERVEAAKRRKAAERAASFV